MKKITVILVSVLIVSVIALCACDNFLSDTKIIANLENNGYVVETYPEEYTLDDGKGVTITYKANTIYAKNDDGERIYIYRMNDVKDCEYFYSKLLSEKLQGKYSDCKALFKYANDKKYGTIVFWGTVNAANAAGFEVVDLGVNE